MLVREMQKLYHTILKRDTSLNAITSTHTHPSKSIPLDLDQNRIPYLQRHLPSQPEIPSHLILTSRNQIQRFGFDLTPAPV